MSAVWQNRGRSRWLGMAGKIATRDETIKAMTKLNAKTKKLLTQVAHRFHSLGMDENSFNNLPVRQQKLFLNGKGTLVTATFSPWGAFSTVVPRTIKQLAPER